MKYADEVSVHSTVRLAKRKRYLQDVDSFIEDYEGLRKREDSNLARVRALEKDLRAMRRARDNAKGELTAAHQKSNELKASLKSLRASRSVRVARAVAKPARLIMGSIITPWRRLRATLKRSRTAVPPSLSKDVSPGNGTAIAPTPSKPTSSAKPQKPAPATREQLLAEFEAAPSRGAAIRLLSHDYFVRGALVEPAEFICRNEALLRGASGSEAALVQNILGQNELLTGEPFLSPRQPNAGYLAERNRIMYCAHSTGHFNSNGYSTRTAGIVAGLKANDEDVLVVARPGYPWDSKVDVEPGATARFELDVSGVTHIYNPGPTWTADRLDFYLTESADVYVREAQRNRVSLVHSASNYVTALPALVAARRLGIPFVYEVRGLWEITQLSTNPTWNESDRYKLAVRLETFVAREADAVLAITPQVRDELVARGVSPDSISLMPNSVDTDEFAPMPALAPLRRKLNIPDDAVVVGYAGSLVPYEGLEDLVSATRILRDQDANVRVVIVGDGVQLPELKRQASELGVLDLITFTGRVPAGDVPDYVSLFDIMPCPRRRLPVTEMVSPLKPLEAMASAKAVVLSDLAPLRDLAGQGQARAIICEPGNPDSLAEAILSLARDEDLRTSLGMRARLWAVSERTWKAAGHRIGAVHRGAQAAARVPARELKNITIGIISDQFTLEGLKGEANLLVLHPDTWWDQLETQRVDALFVESAWEGIDGLWKQKVGFYDEERFSTLESILRWCNAAGVPTIFWNKEDPVHYNRFSRTAERFDHVFTTDASCLRRYKANRGPRQLTVASLPFYAQPRLHNIVPSTRGYLHTLAYAGSYYGDRFKARSEELAKLLNLAKAHGLTIYDRQHLNPESPYRFPDDLAPFVQGGLEYADMVEAYKAHPVHVNVNSVDGSPTMFSRRVMEIAGSGAAVISGKGLGVEHVLNGLVPVVKDAEAAELLIEEWMSNERARLADAWLAYRHVHRAHTAAHRLAYILRTAGLQVIAPTPPRYGVYVDALDAETASLLLSQTVWPAAIYCRSSTEECELPVRLVTDCEEAQEIARAEGLTYLGSSGTGHADRTVFEDLLTANSFGQWNSISISDAGLNTPGVGLAAYGSAEPGCPTIWMLDSDGPDVDLTLRRELRIQASQTSVSEGTVRPKTVLVAGHDLKFATGLLAELRSQGHRVLIDQWHDHTKHDEEQSLSLIRRADVIFCEWTLGNAVWYAKNKQPHQRMVTRVHLQEIFRPYLRNVDYERVNDVVFVGQHILDIAVRDHGVPRDISTVSPNAIDLDALRQPKSPDARFNIGFVGIVPARKRLDKALDVLKALRARDSRYHLFIKGKRPEDFPWMANRPEENAFYEEQYARLEADPLLAGAVTFDPQGDDMAEWYRKIGIVLSVSDFESFHLTLPDGAASGAVPASLAWPGADQIYPTTWLHSDTEQMAEHLIGLADEERWRQSGADAQDFVAANLDARLVLPQLAALVVGGSPS
ncbi:glycosyltransferase [Arthrobacter globiformis]|uniref:glycosyltransferase n=1 Tax=Arthrobacter globiformis TaxID=1665 RepID=UPI002789F75D|nr:glycosyltransferase [Arthrobacter globiformis]MDQ0865774.1 glycosyltransferase involved in cell wall biosynthesis/spore maturation protein CgeB [Arthrobacter globiformis]